MKVSIQFQYMPDENRRPIDGSDHNEPIDVEEGEFLSVPDVGDTVSYTSYEYEPGEDGRPDLKKGRDVVVARKVKTRHFHYSEDGVYINIVVGDVPKGEMPMRLKE